jgi:hypothetical protein
MFTASQGMKPGGVVSVPPSQCATIVRNDKRRKWNVFTSALILAFSPGEKK